jgi:hypothetical protein
MPQNERAPPAATERGSKSKQSGTKYTSAKPQAARNLGEFEIDEESHVRVPAGTYNVALIDWWTGVMFGKSKKLALTFQIVDMGDYFGKKLVRWYNVKRHIGATGRHGNFKPSRGSAFMSDYVRMVGMPSRIDRPSLTKLFNVLIKAEVATVKRDYEQNTILEPLRYSVIRKLIHIEVGNLERRPTA